MQLGLMMRHRLIGHDRQADTTDQEDQILAVLKDIKSVDAPLDERVEAVRACLHDPQSDMIRNYAALALIDLISIDAVPDIIEVLRKQDIAARSGTLLFALNEVEAALPLDILARTAVEGSYEARNEAAFALEQSRVASFDDDMEDRTITAVTPLLNGGDAAAAAVASGILVHIADRKANGLRP